MSNDLIAKITDKCQGSRSFVFDTPDNTSDDLIDRITDKCKRNIDFVLKSEVSDTKASDMIHFLRRSYNEKCDSIVTEVIATTLGESLIEACENNDIVSVSELLELGAKANYVTSNDDYTIFRYSSPIISASKNGHTEIALLLIQSGAYEHEYQLSTEEDFEKEGLIHACFQGHVDTARILLENGANVEDRKSVV